MRYSWQHGTNATRHEAPSQPSLNEGIPISALFAGNGYLLLAADYIGLGQSEAVPEYLHTASTVQAVTDFLQVGEAVLRGLSASNETALFLVGFSQGGCATAGIHRSLEAHNPTGLTLRASAAVAGAYNLRDISIRYAMAQNSTFYLGYVANAYAHVYGQPLSSVIQPQYAPLVAQYFDGSQSYEAIEAVLPATATALLTLEVVAAIDQGGGHWFVDALAANETYQWKPVAPLHIFYGEADKDVSPQDAISAYTYMSGLGGNVTLYNTGNVDHTGSLLRALPHIQQIINQ